MLIRNLKTLWRCTLTEAEALALSFSPQQGEVTVAYQALRTRIAGEWQLLEPPVWELQPLLRGAELGEIFDAKGPRVGALTAAVLRFQLEQDPAKRSDRAACIEWLKAHQHAVQ